MAVVTRNHSGLSHHPELPGIPQWAAIHCRTTVRWMERRWRLSCSPLTEASASLTVSACRADSESVRMTISWTVSSWVSTWLTAAEMASTSALKLVQVIPTGKDREVVRWSGYQKNTPLPPFLYGISGWAVCICLDPGVGGIFLLQKLQGKCTLCCRYLYVFACDPWNDSPDVRVQHPPSLGSQLLTRFIMGQDDLYNSTRGSLSSLARWFRLFLFILFLVLSPSLECRGWVARQSIFSFWMRIFVFLLFSFCSFRRFLHVCHGCCPHGSQHHTQSPVLEPIEFGSVGVGWCGPCGWGILHDRPDIACVDLLQDRRIHSQRCSHQWDNKVVLNLESWRSWELLHQGQSPDDSSSHSIDVRPPCQPSQVWRQGRLVCLPAEWHCHQASSV